MARARKIPKDNRYFRYVNLNPYGITTGDCAYRAMAGFLNVPWKQAVSEMMTFFIDEGYAPSSSDGYERFLSQRHIMKMPQPKVRNYDNVSGYAKMTIRQLIDDRLVGKNGVPINRNPDGTGQNILINVTHHLTVVKWDKEMERYRVEDLWDCSEEYVRNYWVNNMECE